MDPTKAGWKAVYLACLMDSTRAGSMAGSKAVYLACSTALTKDC